MEALPAQWPAGTLRQSLDLIGKGLVHEAVPGDEQPLQRRRIGNRGFRRQSGTQRLTGEKRFGRWPRVHFAATGKTQQREPAEAAHAEGRIMDRPHAAHVGKAYSRKAGAGIRQT